MNLKLYLKTLPGRVVFTLLVMLVWWLAVEFWPDNEEPAPVAAGQCVGLQCTYADDTAKALQAQDQLTPAKK